ncbi:uncharacterized protein CEXT_55091 [Caerostris extrusa]|uniref:Uncharacterized protein n=1 Tax=Caerostris extrusa TaxID=172846 RepID=A0AAV4RAN2_CAEEX|nr:uncharacterized protein CEXT_55091 [Caerostris extrusa]
MQDLFNHLLQQLNSDKSFEEREKLFEVYESISKTMQKMDESFSFPIFIATLLNLFGLFWAGHWMALHPKLSVEYFLYTLCPVIYHLSHHLLLMVSALMTNEKAVEAKIMIQCLLKRFSLDIGIKIKYEKNIALESNLTLWKIYVFDRSLIITSFACLLTYGILLDENSNVRECNKVISFYEAIYRKVENYRRVTGASPFPSSPMKGLSCTGCQKLQLC